MKEELCDHMKSTSIQIQQISDEVHSIKKSISLSSSILTGQVADMCEKAEAIVKRNDMSNWERCIFLCRSQRCSRSVRPEIMSR